jgi:hypothetical protein
MGVRPFAAAVEAELDRVPSPNAAETSSTWHHDTLVKAVLKVSSELEDRVQVADPGWWVDAADSLKPLVDGRNAARALLMVASRSRPLRRRLKALRMQLKVEVKAAKTSWVEKLVKGINDQSTGQGGSAECWQLGKKLRAGLERSVSRKTTMMRRSPTDKLSETAEENAEVFREFFEAQYSRKPSGKLSAADKLPQLPVFEEESRLPSRKDVRTAVRKLNLSGPQATPATTLLLGKLCWQASEYSTGWRSTPADSGSTKTLLPTGRPTCSRFWRRRGAYPFRRITGAS